MEMKGDPGLAPTRPLGEEGETGAAQDRQTTSQGRPNTAIIGPKNAQDCTQRPVNFTTDHQSKQ